MHEPLDPRDELIERLRAFGRRPVDPSLQSQHLTAIAAVPVSAGRSLRSAVASRVKVAAAVLGGFLIGTTGLASAGVLGPLQPVAATVVEKATPLEVPEGAKDKAAKARSGGTERYYGPECVVTGGQPARNRGEYLKQQREVSPEAFEAAKQTNCGKPLSSLSPAADAAEREQTEVTPENKGRAGCVDDGDRTTGKPDCTPPATVDNGTTPDDGDGKGKPDPKTKPKPRDDTGDSDDDSDDDVSGKSGGGSERRPEEPGPGPGGKGKGGGRSQLPASPAVEEIDPVD